MARNPASARSPRKKALDVTIRPGVVARTVAFTVRDIDDNSTQIVRRTFTASSKKGLNSNVREFRTRLKAQRFQVTRSQKVVFDRNIPTP